MTQSNYYNNENSLKNYLSKTFSTVAIGIAISAIAAFISSKLMPAFFMHSPGFASIFSLIAIFAELGVAIYFSARLQTMSKSTAWACYITYSVLTGISFWAILDTYATASITLAFVATTIMFVCMAVIGYTSNIDYTKVYSLFLPAVIAGFIVSLLNAFIFHSPLIDMAIVYIGIVLFLVITAADIQRLKDFYYAGQYNSELSDKFMILGAFQLYLDFVNLFIRIIRIFGRRRND